MNGLLPLPLARTTRRSRLVAFVVVLAAVLAVPATAGASHGGPHYPPPLPPPVVANPHVPIVGFFHVSPDSGPPGTTIKYQGFCGFAAGGQARAVPALLYPDDTSVVEVFLGSVVPLTGPWGAFTTSATIPLGLAPGDYLAAIVCFRPDGTSFIKLTSQPFEVTGATRG